MKCIIYPQELGKVDHNTIEYVPFRKDFYVEVPEIANMTKEEVEAYRSVSQSLVLYITDIYVCLFSPWSIIQPLFLSVVITFLITPQS